MENIRISNAILSRFDLVFLMLDDPDFQRDKKLSEHVMKLHSRNRKRKLNEFGADSDIGLESQSSSAFKRLKGVDTQDDMISQDSLQMDD